MKKTTHRTHCRIHWKPTLNGLSKWWQSWYGGPLLMAFAFGIMGLHYSSDSGNAKSEKQLMSKVDKHIHHECREAKDIVYIDVSYDKVLVPRISHDGIPIGNVPITDRQKLHELLQQLSVDTLYRGIMLDVSLNASTPTDADSALAETLLQMPRTVISCATEGNLIDQRLDNIAGQTAYPVNAAEAGFVKYPLKRNNKKSMPLLLYEKTTGRTLHHLLGSVYRDGWSLSCGNPFPTLDCKVGATDTLYLGDDIIEGGWIKMQGNDFLKGKYIVIGAVTEGDIHNSYVGDISGPEININTYLALTHGKHRIGILTFFLVLGFYFLLSFSIVRSRWKLTDRLQRSQWWPVRAIGLVLSGLIYTILLKIPFLLNYLLFDQILTFTSVAFWFLIVNKIVQTNKIIKK